MKIQQLLEALPQKEIIALGDGAQAVSGLKYASNQIKAGDAFVAVVGFHTDGHKYIPDAAKRGASLIVGSNRALLKNFVASADYNGVAVVSVDDERTALADLAAAFYDYPARKLGVIGVTGTDGKTTTTFLISDLLENAGKSTGLMGTVDLKVGARRWSNDSRQTTLEAPEVQALLAEMVAEKVDYAVLESSSHGLALRKLLHCAYDVAVFTNVTAEHLDFHGTVEQYRLDKARLFGYLSDEPPKPFLPFPKTAVVNRDDPHADLYINTALETARQAGREVRVLTYAVNSPADIFATEIVSDARQNTYTLNTPDGAIRLTLPLPGDFNVYNSMAAATVGYSQGLSLAQIKAGLEQVKGVPGRMQTVNEGQDFAVIVDYAHTPQSLSKVLTILRPLTTGKLIAVFGSAGERDRVKRPEQGRVAAELADFAVFTNEDPRLEDAEQIINEIAAGAEVAGWQEGQNFLKITDRTEAIRAAFARARAGDTVLLAGKGHEQCVIIGTEKVPWDERTVAQNELRHLLGH